MSVHSPLNFQQPALSSHYGEQYHSGFHNVDPPPYNNNSNSNTRQIHQMSFETQNPLEHFSTFANQDVEMQAPLAENSFYLVPDTNILLHYLDTLATFADDIEKSPNCNVVIVIPTAVINELDWQKKHNDTGWFSRKASIWLWRKIQEKNVLKGQGSREFLSKCDNNDDRIIDCASYFARIRPTVLCSADKNLCFKAQARDDLNLGVVNPGDHSRWSARHLGSYIFGSQREEQFSEWNIAYTEDSVVVPEISRDDNEMDVDTENLHNEQEILPKDARILLHLQVIDIFVGLLRELVAADQRDVQRKSAEGASASMHAPSIVASIHALNRDANVSEMSLGVLLSWVTDSPSGRLPLQADNPPLSYFLTKPYQKHTGSRPGNEWSPKDWLVSLRKLRMIGQAWGKRGEDIVNILRQDLLPHLQRVFGDDDLMI